MKKQCLLVVKLLRKGFIIKRNYYVYWTNISCKLYRFVKPAGMCQAYLNKIYLALAGACCFYTFLISGVMAARGILTNPAMYAGYDSLPLQCVQDWVSNFFIIANPWNKDSVSVNICRPALYTCKGQPYQLLKLSTNTGKNFKC